ncbi:MAG: hypothetical protein QXV45_06365, partial [Candidatus Bathyarchaeia archaeon]
MLFMDAIQSLGAIRLDCGPADFASGCHKWLLAPFWIGILYMRRGFELEPRWDELGPQGVGQAAVGGAGSRRRGWAT